MRDPRSHKAEEDLLDDIDARGFDLLLFHLSYLGKFMWPALMSAEVGCAATPSRKGLLVSVAIVGCGIAFRLPYPKTSDRRYEEITNNHRGKHRSGNGVESSGLTGNQSESQ